MKQIIKTYWYEFALALIMLLLFVQPVVGNIILALLFIYNLKQFKQLKELSLKTILLLAIPVLLGLYGLILDALNYHIKDSFYVRLVPFVLFPILLQTSKQFDAKKFYLSSVVQACGLSLFLIIYGLFNAELINPLEPETSIFGHGFLMPIEGHATYVSFYFFIALIFASQLNKKLRILASITLSLGIFFTASKINFGLLILYFGYQIIKNGISKQIILAFVLIGTVFTFIYSKSNTNRYNPLDRFIQLKDHLLYGSKDVSTHGRIIVWNNALALIKQNPVVGNGVSYGHHLIQSSEGNDYEHLNAHNQFFQYWIDYGFIGVLLLLLYLIAPFSKHKPLNISALIIVFILINFLFENILDRHWGVMMVACYMSIIHLDLLKNPTISE